MNSPDYKQFTLTIQAILLELKHTINSKLEYYNVNIKNFKQQDNHSLYHLNKKAYLCLFAPSFGLKSRASSHVPRSVPCPSFRPLNAHRYLPAKREGYSASPFAPRAAKEPHENQNIMLAPQLASTAELPLQQAELTPNSSQGNPSNHNSVA